MGQIELSGCGQLHHDHHLPPCLIRVLGGIEIEHVDEADALRGFHGAFVQIIIQGALEAFPYQGFFAL